MPMPSTVRYTFPLAILHQATRNSNHHPDSVDIYLLTGSPNRLKLPSSVHRDVDLVLRTSHTPQAGVAFRSAQQYLLDSMYQGQFQNFVKQKIIEKTEARFANVNFQTSDGLADCFCLTNPRLRVSRPYSIH